MFIREYDDDSTSEASRMAEREIAEIAEEEFEQSERERLREYQEMKKITPLFLKTKGSRNYCDACSKPYIVKHPSQRFCCRRCKDFYHNTVNPERAERARFYGSK